MLRLGSVTLLVILTASLGNARASPSAPVSGVPRLAHIVVIVFENHERSEILGSDAAPTFTRLARDGAQATRYDAVAHPSLPNYLALVSGSVHGVTSDCTGCQQTGPTIGGQLTARGRRWAAYAEGYPDSSRFAKKNVPFRLDLPGRRFARLGLDQFDPKRRAAFSLRGPGSSSRHARLQGRRRGRVVRHTFITPLRDGPEHGDLRRVERGDDDAGGGGNVPLIVAGSAWRPHAVSRDDQPLRTAPDGRSVAGTSTARPCARRRAAHWDLAPRRRVGISRCGNVARRRRVERIWSGPERTWSAASARWGPMCRCPCADAKEHVHAPRWVQQCACPFGTHPYGARLRGHTARHDATQCRGAAGGVPSAARRTDRLGVPSRAEDRTRRQPARVARAVWRRR